MPVRGRVLQDLAPKEVVFFDDDEILVLGFFKDLPLGEGVLSMKFNGTLNDQMRGFYRRYGFPLILNFFLALKLSVAEMEKGQTYCLCWYERLVVMSLIL
jgi:hypothetical protein